MFNGSWGGRSVDGLIGFVEEWGPDILFGMGGHQAYFGEVPWLALGLLPALRYEPRFAASVGRWLLAACTNSQHFFPDRLPADRQTDFAHLDNPTSANGFSAIPYEAIRRCEFDRNAKQCKPLTLGGPFGTGDYGCEAPDTPTRNCTRPSDSPNITNLAGSYSGQLTSRVYFSYVFASDAFAGWSRYMGAYSGVLATACSATDVPSILHADVGSLDFLTPHTNRTAGLHLIFNPHAVGVNVTVQLPRTSTLTVLSDLVCAGATAAIVPPGMSSATVSVRAGAAVVLEHTAQRL